MNAGEMREQIEILTLVQDGNYFRWEPSDTAWAKAERPWRRNLYSAFGMAAKPVQFTLWPSDLTLHNAIRWNGLHCFLTDIDNTDVEHFVVAAAMIEPVTCELIEAATGRNVMNGQRTDAIVKAVFPACLTEKYAGYEINTPKAVTDVTYVLVTPKEIEARAGNLINIGGVKYAVRKCHTLDAHKNEYEITRRDDVNGAGS